MTATFLGMTYEIAAPPFYNQGDLLLRLTNGTCLQLLGVSIDDIVVDPPAFNNYGLTVDNPLPTWFDISSV